MLRLHKSFLATSIMTQLFRELVEFLEATEKGGDVPPVGDAHQELINNLPEQPSSQPSTHRSQLHSEQRP